MIPQYDWQQFIAQAFKEDIGTDIKGGDHTSLSCIPTSATGSAKLLVKEDGVLAGVELAKMIAEHFDTDLKFEPVIADSAKIKKGDIAFHLHGKAQSILSVERLLLNCMQRMSGVATLTSKYVEKLKGTNIKILDTRKTTPLFRAVEKWAVRLGGGDNHRFGLYDMIMIKDNHVDFAGGITQAIDQVNRYLREKNLDLKIEIETRNINEVQQVLETGHVRRIMLDNFKPEDIHQAVSKIGGKYEIEISGGITLDNIQQYAIEGVDFISVGAVTHSYKSLDLSLKAEFIKSRISTKSFMADVELHLNKQQYGAFTVQGDVGQTGEMEVAIDSKHITVYHTEVTKAAEGKGFAKQLLDAMVAYAREHNLKVIALCPYTNAQFTKHPELYDDIWEKNIR